MGDLILTDAGDLNVNRWLCENGWAFPTFYASMTDDEITTLRNLAVRAKSSKLGVWRSTGNMVREQDFDVTMTFRGKGAQPNPASDRGKVLLPKLFRRLSTWVANKRSKMAPASFLAYLAQKPDELHLTDEFLQQGTGGSSHTRLDGVHWGQRRVPRKPVGPGLPRGAVPPRRTRRRASAVALEGAAIKGGELPHLTYR